MSANLHPAGGFVLVGGASRRMGHDKARLEVNGQPLFMRTAELLRHHVQEVTLLGSPTKYSGFGFPVLPDRRPGRGPLEAICTGLAHSTHEWNIFLACDMPLLSADVLRLLLERALVSHAHGVVPVTAGRWQPLCAAYHRRCLPLFESALQEASGRVMSALARVRIEALEADGSADKANGETTFANVNTPQAWERIQRQLGTQLG